MTYDDFVIQIDAAPDGGYIVQVKASPAGLGDGVLRLPTPVKSPDSPQEGRNLGDELSRALFQGQVRELFEQSFRWVDAEPNHCLRILLNYDPSDPATAHLASLPWELLRRTDTHQFLSLSSPVVRYLKTPFPQPTIPSRATLRVLALIANPVGHESIDVEEERQSLYDTWTGVEGLEITILERLDASSLHRVLQERDYDAFHFIGHGGIDSTGESGLYFESKSGEPELKTGPMLKELVNGIESLRLVFLNACRGARLTEELDSNPFVKVAETLVMGGLPAVVAMPSALSIKGASEFDRVFYGCLADGDPVDGAVVEGRRSIYSALPRSIEWTTPILFMRVADGVIFHKETSVVDAGKIRRMNKRAVLREPPVPYGRLAVGAHSLKEGVYLHPSALGSRKGKEKIDHVLIRLNDSIDEVKASYFDLSRREINWRHFKELVSVPLWEAVEPLEEEPCRRQLADVLDAAVSKLEAFQLKAHHFSAIESTLTRLSAESVEEQDVDDCENEWRAADVDTLPSLREAFEEWLRNTPLGIESVG